MFWKPNGLRRHKKKASRNGFVSSAAVERRPLGGATNPGRAGIFSAGRHPWSTAWHEAKRTNRTAKTLFSLLQPRSNPAIEVLLQTVGKHLHGFAEVGVADLGQLLELAHALGGFGAKQVAFAGMHTNELAGASDLETFGGAAMRFELLFRLRSVTRHC